jgi:predicted small lipoprotein YifL
MSMSKITATAMLLLAVLLSACGRKGPLYMQQAPVQPAPASNLPIEQKPVSPNLPVQSQPVPTQTEDQKKP